jgi:hypothetical protein
MASSFEIHRSEVHLLDAGAGAGHFTPEFVAQDLRGPEILR